MDFAAYRKQQLARIRPPNSAQIGKKWEPAGKVGAKNEKGMRTKDFGVIMGWRPGSLEIAQLLMTTYDGVYAETLVGGHVAQKGLWCNPGLGHRLAGNITIMQNSMGNYDGIYAETSFDVHVAKNHWDRYSEYAWGN